VGATFQPNLATFVWIPPRDERRPGHSEDLQARDGTVSKLSESVSSAVH